MARLLPGENPKIDMINSLVADVQSGNIRKSEEGLVSLLELFHPMLLSICSKWSIYFNDSAHNIKPFNDLMSDAQYWFIQYTKYSYNPDGAATYNKFIKDHMTQRIRYIYECELKYFMKSIFPDPDKNSEESDDGDMLEYVAYNYTSNHQNELEESMIEEQTTDNRTKLAHAILDILNDREYFNEREQFIFSEIVYKGNTHEKMGELLGISRTRVTQILKKTKAKLYKRMESSHSIWSMIDNADIIFNEQE